MKLQLYPIINNYSLWKEEICETFYQPANLLCFCQFFVFFQFFTFLFRIFSTFQLPTLTSHTLCFTYYFYSLSIQSVVFGEKRNRERYKKNKQKLAIFLQLLKGCDNNQKIILQKQKSKHKNIQFLNDENIYGISQWYYF